MTRTPTFPATIKQDEKGRFRVHFQDIEEATGEGKSLQEAIDNAREVLTQTLESRLTEGLLEALSFIEKGQQAIAPVDQDVHSPDGMLSFIEKGQQAIAPAQRYIDKLKPKRKPLTFPGGLSGKGEFNFSDEAKDEIITLLGKEHLQGVWIESSGYILSKEYHGLKSVGEKNKELVKIKNHVDSLLKLLSDQTTRDHLLNKAGEIFGDYASLRLAKDPFSTFTSLKIIDDLKLIHMVCSVAILQDKPSRRGRPKGTKSTPEYDLLERLYFRCRMVYGKPLPLTPGRNLLARLVDVLKEPLGLGGDLPSMVRKVIEKNQKTRHD
jgi:predicted RNase H-like HicB family nuclease